MIHAGVDQGKNIKNAIIQIKSLGVNVIHLPGVLLKFIKLISCPKKLKQPLKQTTGMHMPKITINLKAKTLKAVQNHANETNQLLDKVIEEAIESLLDPGYEIGLDELMLKAKEVNDKYEQVSAALLQRELKIGYARAKRILNNLGKQ